MITAKQLQEAHSIISQGVIQVIFENEDSFKKEVLSQNGWDHSEYTIERVHCAEAYRLTLKHDDFREKDVYIPSGEVYSWFMSEQDKFFNLKENNNG